MNLITKSLLATGMASMAVSPVLAASATPSTVASARVAPVSVDASQLRGNNGRGLGAVYALLAVAAVAAVFFITRDKNNNNGRPVSP